MDRRIFTDRDLVVDRRVRVNANSFRDLDVAADRGVVGDARSWIDYGAGMDVRLDAWFRMENAQRARVREVRIFHAQDNHVAIDGRVFAEIDGRGARRVYAWRVTRVGEKRDVSFSGFVETSRTVNLDVVGSAFNARVG